MDSKILKIGRAAIAAVLTIHGMSTLVACGIPSKIAQHDIQAAAVPVSPDTQIADLLRLKGDVVTNPFQKIITKLARTEKSVCDFEAEVRLVTVCRSMDGNAVGSPTTARSLEAVKSLYGIRKALCETAVSGAEIPITCRDLLPATASVLSQRKLTSSELELATSDKVSSCLRKLQEHHYFWTSYSNNLQDARDVSHLVRSDVELQNLVNNYRDFEASINDFRRDFEVMHTLAETWNLKAFQRAENFAAVQENAFLDLFRTTSNISMELQQLRQASELSAHQLQDTFKVLMSQLKESLTDVAEESQSINLGISTMKDAMGDMYVSAAIELASFTASERSALVAAFDSLETRIAVLNNPIEFIESSLETLSSNISEVLKLQEKQMSSAQKQVEMTNITLELQNISTRFAKELYHSLESSLSIAEDFSSVIATFTYLIELVTDHGPLVIILCTYMALRVVLAALDGVLISHRIASRIRAGYVVLQAIAFLSRQADPFGKSKLLSDFVKTMIEGLSMTKSVCFILSITTITCIAVLAFNYFKQRRTLNEHSDVEKAQVKNSNKVSSGFPMSESQRQRLQSISRKTRNSTAPPGL